MSQDAVIYSPESQTEQFKANEASSYLIALQVLARLLEEYGRWLRAHDRLPVVDVQRQP